MKRPILAGDAQLKHRVHVLNATVNMYQLCCQIIFLDKYKVRSIEELLAKERQQLATIDSLDHATLLTILGELASMDMGFNILFGHITKIRSDVETAVTRMETLMKQG